jgi:hypothetical protein
MFRYRTLHISRTLSSINNRFYSIQQTPATYLKSKFSLTDITIQQLIQSISSNTSNYEYEIVKAHFGGTCTSPLFHSKLYQNSFKFEQEWDTGDNPAEELNEEFSSMDVNSIEELRTGLTGDMAEYVEASDNGYCDSLLEYIESQSDNLPNIRSLVINDTTNEDIEVSWIPQMHITQLLKSYPKLLHFQYQGNGDILEPFEHEHLLSFCVIVEELGDHY